MYKVGEDIPAAEYEVVLDDEEGYIEVSKDSSHQLKSIVTNEIVQANTYITVKKGQYLTLQGVHVEE